MKRGGEGGAALLMLSALTRYSLLQCNAVVKVISKATSHKKKFSVSQKFLLTNGGGALAYCAAQQEQTADEQILAVGAVRGLTRCK